MKFDGSFAGGLAQGLRNGVGLYNTYQIGVENKRQREVDAQLREAMADSVGLSNLEVKPQQTNAKKKSTKIGLDAVNTRSA